MGKDVEEATLTAKFNFADADDETYLFKFEPSLKGPASRIHEHVPINLELLSQLTDRFYPDYQLLTAISGEAGIDIAQDNNLELILLDILMPGLDGYETCKILKKSAKTKHIPVIMVSALGNNSSARTKGLNAGADSFISKPFDQSELKAQISVALRIKHAENLLRKRNEKLELDIKNQSSEFTQKEERYTQISEHAKEFYWEIDKFGIFSYVSPVVEQTLNISSLDIIGKKNYIDLFQLEKLNNKEKVTGKNKFRDIEICITKASEQYWLSISGFPIFNNKGEYESMRGICYDITRRKKAELKLKENLKEIQQYQSKLKKLNIEITLIEEKEKRRIAENLHDSLGQTLSLAYLTLSSISVESTIDYIKDTIKTSLNLLSKAISESRTLTYDLSPPILYELGLLPAINWKLEQFKKETGYKINFTNSSNKIVLSKEYNILLYRAVGELLANIHKHAKCTIVDIKIFANNNSFQISIEDNGVGFDDNILEMPNNHNVGFGLISITERIQNINGIFTIQSKIGEGTKAHITIELGEDISKV